jgi:hypothetical protein
MMEEGFKDVLKECIAEDNFQGNPMNKLISRNRGTLKVVVHILNNVLKHLGEIEQRI